MRVILIGMQKLLIYMYLQSDIA